ncbi:uncharacterized protein LOC6552344 [Drosophila erecta]|uniref:GG11244 n=1 Tax=Drosophila erecta TaxID=7220 RepID=B3P287_DROER|nr:uncharacterized protein LOC6552344 [Drosophila erecta]EDV47837.1 uncharacterized protein Dere_GG11244 [Drosophila erecta]
MFKSKSFDLVIEEKTKKPERLYQPRRMRWLKYIILPAVFSFALLLILVNVDFSDNNEDSTHLGNRCDTSLLISNYGLENNTLSQSFFAERVALQSLFSENGTMIHINDMVFNQESTMNITSLQLINVQLENLTDSALQGLQKLQNFTLVNESNHLRPLGFLSAVAESLISAEVHQSLAAKITNSVCDLLGSLNFTQLKYSDLSGTHLEKESFDNLPALEQLILKNCGLDHIEREILKPRHKSLRHLDLGGARQKHNYEYQLDEAGYSSESTTSAEDIYTIAAERAMAPELVGTTTPLSTSIGTLSPSTSTASISTTTASESTVSTTPSSKCEEELCQDLVCSRISTDSVASADPGSSACQDGLLVEICESDCTTPTFFCVILGESFTFPSNCCSHQSMRCVVETTQVSWFEDHGGLVIGLGVGLLLLGSFLGMLIVFGTLRLKPSWLGGSGRRESSTKGLIQGRFEKDPYVQVDGAIATIDNNEYVTAYHRYLEQANHSPTESNKYICPPRDRAPSVPPSSDYPLPLPARNCNVYESCELYEELP